MATTQTEVRTITPVPITREAFAPFGEVISMEGIDPIKSGSSFYKEKTSLYRTAVHDSDGPVDILVYTSGMREFRVRYLERHLGVTQMFLPLGANPYLVVVARPDAELDENGIPLVEELRAFFVPGNVGAVAHRGTWHEPPFALAANSAFLVTSHPELTEGLLQPLNERHEVEGFDVDKRNVTERSGYELRIEFP